MGRRVLVFLMAALRPFLYALHRGFATRVVHSVLRGLSRDRLDLLGDEYFQYKLKPYLKPDGVTELKRLQSTGADVVLVSQGLDHVMSFSMRMGSSRTRTPVAWYVAIVRAEAHPVSPISPTPRAPYSLITSSG